MMSLVIAQVNAEPFGWIVGLGSAAAAVTVTWLFLKDRKEDRKERTEERTLFLSTLAAERTDERKQSEAMRTDFSDLLREHRDQSGRLASEGHQAVRELTETISSSKADLQRYVERAMDQIDRLQDREGAAE